MITEIRRTKIYITNSYYIMTILVSAASIALAWIATMIINKYLPFLIDIRKIKRG